MGIPWDKPVRRLNEFLDGLLPLLADQPADATVKGRLDELAAAGVDEYVAATFDASAEAGRGPGRCSGHTTPERHTLPSPGSGTGCTPGVCTAPANQGNAAANTWVASGQS